MQEYVTCNVAPRGRRSAGRVFDKTIRWIIGLSWLACFCVVMAVFGLPLLLVRLGEKMFGK